MGSWTGGRRKTKSPPVERIKTLVITNPLIFAKRDKKGEVPTEKIEWSEQMIKQAAKKWPQVLISCPTFDVCPSVAKAAATDDSFYIFAKSLNIPNVELILFTTTDPEEATKIWKERIIKAGGVYKRAKNPREVTYLNIQKYFDAPHITWAGTQDHKKAKIEIEKEKSFQDYQELRKRKAEW